METTNKLSLIQLQTNFRAEIGTAQLRGESKTAANIKPA